MSQDRKKSSYEQRSRGEVVAELKDIYNHFFDHEYVVPNYVYDHSRKHIVSSTMRAMVVGSILCERAKVRADSLFVFLVLSCLFTGGEVPNGREILGTGARTNCL